MNHWQQLFAPCAPAWHGQSRTYLLLADPTEPTPEPVKPKRRHYRRKDPAPWVPWTRIEPGTAPATNYVWEAPHD